MRSISVRVLRLLLFGLPFCAVFAWPAAAQSGASCPVFGAIRWDAWHGADGKVGRQVEKTLGPRQWHYRVPFCGRVLAENRVEIECDSQPVMDQEILYAAKAGIDYWLFSVHGPSNPLGLAFKYYLTSPNRHLVNFSLLAALANWGKPGAYQRQVHRFVESMKLPSYQKVLGNRPLIYVGFLRKRQLAEWGDPGNFRRAVAHLREEARRAGLGNPYIVVMHGDPEQAKRLTEQFGFDAISTYATHGMQKDAPYSALAAHAHRHWDRSKATGAQVVPIIMAGWDNRPRAAFPAPWQMDRLPNLGRAYYAPPRPEELAAHVRDAFRWVAQNSSSGQPKAVIAYAWNEHDEGGWISPTLGDGTARIDALAGVKAACAR